MNDERPTVFIIDDDSSVRRGLSRLIKAAGLNVKVFESVPDYLNRSTSNNHGCLVLDVKMPGVNGMELQSMLMKEAISPPIIFVSGHSEIPDAAKAMKKGAIDFLTKPVDRDHLLKAIAEALQKDRVNRKALADQAEIQERLALLSPREKTVLEFVISGMLNKQIAYALDITEDTVKKHRGRVMKKLHAGSLAELIHLAELGDVKPAKPNGM